MADITVTSVHTSVPLTNLAMKYKVPLMVAPEIFPVVGVRKEADKIYTFNQEELLDVDDKTLRAAGTEANEIEWDVSSTTYTAEEYALKKLVPTRVKNNADVAVRPAISTVQKLKSAIALDYERRVQAIVQSTSQITNTAGVTTKWDAASGATPEKDVDTAKNSVLLNAGVAPNAILMNYEVANALKRWLKAQAYTTYSEYLDRNELPPRLWGLDTIVARAVRNTAKPGQTQSLAFVFNDNVLVFYREANPSLDATSLGYTLRQRNWRTKTWFDDKRDGDYYEVSVIQDELLTMAACGYIIEDVLT
jgi:hypothetical protein